MFRIRFETVTIDGVDEIEAARGLAIHIREYFREFEERGRTFTPQEKLAIRRRWALLTAIETDNGELAPHLEYAFFKQTDPSVLTLTWVRSRRDRLLRLSDHRLGPDSPLTVEQRLSWQTYRQNLRDLPAQSGDPANLVWPGEPD